MSERFGIDLEKKYGQLTPIEPIGYREGRRYWMFRCDCGSTKVIQVDPVLNGHTKSCGHTRRPGLRTLRKKLREELLEKQGNFCAICLKEFVQTPEVDHNHLCCPQKHMCRGCVRGLLCETCNRGLGLFKDKLEILESAVAYLRRYQCPKSS